MPDRDLRLHHELLLLATKDEEGTPEFGAWTESALSAAILTELLMSDRIAMEGKDARLVSTETTGDEILDDALRAIADEGRPRPLTRWMSSGCGVKDLRRRTAEELCRRGVLEEKVVKVLFVFDRTTYPELDPEPERRLVERLRRIVLDDVAEADPRTLATLALAHRTSLLRAVFSKDELKQHEDRIEALAKGELVGGVAKEAIEAAQAAAFLTTVIIPAVVVPTVIR